MADGSQNATEQEPQMLRLTIMSVCISLRVDDNSVIKNHVLKSDLSPYICRA
jgi:hypothetical protein